MKGCCTINSFGKHGSQRLCIGSSIRDKRAELPVANIGGISQIVVLSAASGALTFVIFTKKAYFCGEIDMGKISQISVENKVLSIKRTVIY